MSRQVLGLLLGGVVLLAVASLWTVRAGRRPPHRGEPAGHSVVVVVNPVKVPAALQAEVVAALRRAGVAGVRLVPTTATEPGERQAREAALAGADVVVACGGDGTVRACVSGLVGTQTPLAILPYGTGNLLARNLGIPLDLSGAARTAALGALRRIDVGTVGGESFAVMAGIGFDAALIRDATEGAKARTGPLAYVLAGLRQMSRPGFDCTVRVDDAEPLHRRARTVLVGNVGRLQGGLPLLPAASPDDGLLDVAVVFPRRLVDWLPMVARALLGRPHRRHVRFLRGRRVSVDAHPSQPTQLDGEPRPEAGRAVFEVRPGALLVCVPGPAIGPGGER